MRTATIGPNTISPPRRNSESKIILLDINFPFRNKSEGKDKTKIRTKEYSKGTGFIKEEHKFPAGQPEEVKKKDINFLNYEEVDNLQDMINYAAEMNQGDKNQNIYPIESLYSQVVNSETNVQSSVYTNEKIDTLIAELLKR